MGERKGKEKKKRAMWVGEDHSEVKKGTPFSEQQAHGCAHKHWGWEGVGEASHRGRYKKDDSIQKTESRITKL